MISPANAHKADDSISINSLDVPAKRIEFALTSAILSVQTEAAGSQLHFAESEHAFAITETELKLIAAPAIIGLSRSPKNG